MCILYGPVPLNIQWINIWILGGVNLSKRIDLVVGDNVYYYFLYQKSRKMGDIGVSFQQEIRNILDDYIKNCPIDKIRLHNFLESQGLENQEMKEKRLSAQKKGNEEIF